MSKKYLDYVTSILIAINSLFLIFYIAARLFAPQGSFLQQGYIGKQGKVNLSNVAVSALVILLLSFLANRLMVAKQSKQTHFIREVGLVVLTLAAIWFLIVTILVLYGFLTGQILGGIQF